MQNEIKLIFIQFFLRGRNDKGDANENKGGIRGMLAEKLQFSSNTS